MKLRERSFRSLVGKKFGRLEVLSLKEKRIGTDFSSSRFYWWCKCVCGTELSVRSDGLTRGYTKSCGCLQRDITKKMAEVFRVTHGQCTGNRTILYSKWRSIRTRCSNKNDRNYHNYGGRGITCAWKSFEEFRDDMQESFFEHAEKHGIKSTTIERINVDKEYSSENCRWATRKEQGFNKRNNHRLSYRGKEKTVTEWAVELNIQPATLFARIQNGWSPERAITTPLRGFYKPQDSS